MSAGERETSTVVMLFKKTFSLPVSSWLNPARYIRHRVTTRPFMGINTREITLSRVDFPAPFLPITQIFRRIRFLDLYDPTLEMNAFYSCLEQN